jgi:hypothetical protein
MMNTRIPILRYCSCLSFLANEFLVAGKDQKGFGRTERNNLKSRNGHPTIEPMCPVWGPMAHRIVYRSWLPIG